MGQHLSTHYPLIQKAAEEQEQAIAEATMDRIEGQPKTDARQNTEDGMGTGQSRVPAQTWHRFNLTDLPTFLTTFAGLASLIYVLGLFVLWGPIARTYTQDFLTAWHAVSLAPRVVVAGLGVTQLVAFPLLLMGLTFVLIGMIEIGLMGLRFVHSKLRGGRRPKSDSVDSQFDRDARFMVSAATAWGVIAFYAGWHIIISLHHAIILGVFVWGIGLVVLLLSVPVSVALISEREQAIASLMTLIREIVTAPSRQVDKAAEDKKAEDAGNGVSIVTAIKELLTIRRSTLFEILWLLAIFLFWAPIIFGIWYGFGRAAPWILQLGIIKIRSTVDFLIFFAVLLLACVEVVLTAYAYTTHVRKCRPGFFDRDEGLLARGRQLRVFQWQLITQVFVLSLLMAFLLTFLRIPPLPTVEVGGNINVKGSLLAHTEGYWYVFSGENELVAIPDSKVQNVRVLPENEEQPILAPKFPKIWTRISENINSRSSDNSVHDS